MKEIVKELRCESRTHDKLYETNENSKRYICDENAEKSENLIISVVFVSQFKRITVSLIYDEKLRYVIANIETVVISGQCLNIKSDLT